MSSKKIWLSIGLLALAAARARSVQPASPHREPSRPVRSAPVLPGKWTPNLLYAMLTSTNQEAGRLLYRAAFAAGPAIIPQLQAALSDDRTATFAARSLAYIGGRQALDALSKLVADPRNLDLRRFYYGALGGSGVPSATAILLHQIRNSDREPDRSVTQDAILALTVHSDAALVPQLRAISKEITDPVIQDDIENAAEVIETRARYLSEHAGKTAGGSVGQAIRTYFIPALEGAPTAAQAGNQHSPPVDVRMVSQTFSPNKARVLAHVIFETPQALANYEMVLQKEGDAWRVASVWLGAEAKKAHPALPHPPVPKS